MVYATLALIGSLEAVAFLFRYRSATHKSLWYSGGSCMAVTVLRSVFVFYGASAAFNGDNVVLVAVAYAVPATVVNTVLHWWLDREKSPSNGA